VILNTCNHITLQQPVTIPIPLSSICACEVGPPVKKKKPQKIKVDMF